MNILRNQGNWIRKRKHAGSQPPVLNAFLRSVCVALLLLPIIPVFGADVLLVDDDDSPDVRIGLLHVKTSTSRICSYPANAAGLYLMNDCGRT